MEMLDEAGGTDPGIDTPLFCVIGPMTTPARRAEGGVAHQRFSKQVDQFVRIDGIHAPTICRERNTNNGDGKEVAAEFRCSHRTGLYFLCSRSRSTRLHPHG